MAQAAVAADHMEEANPETIANGGAEGADGANGADGDDDGPEDGGISGADVTIDEPAEEKSQYIFPEIESISKTNKIMKNKQIENNNDENLNYTFYELHSGK